jgi:CRISPR-associated protein Cas1
MTIPVPASSLRATLAEAADPVRLAAAWADVLASDLGDGILGTGVSHFAGDAEKNLADIGSRLMTGTYEPGWLTPVSLPRPDGRARVLHIPTVRDRIVERSILTLVNPVIDPWLGPFSYAYRPGLGVADAAQTIAALRDEGLGWAARADFHDCFGTIPLSRLRRLLPVLIEDADLLGLVEAFLARHPAPNTPGNKQLTGLAQGSPLSPLWANLVLADFDSRVAMNGYPLVRYSDDIVALAADHDGAWEAMRVMSEAASELGMAFGADKSGVMSFDEGFSFLGEDFGPRYPPAQSAPRIAEPDRRVVYLAMQGAHARLDRGRLVVESAADAELLNVPSGLVERVVCFGAVGISAGLRSWALASDIDLVFLSRRGTYLGHAWPAASGRRLARLRAQLSAAEDEDRALRFARAVVSAKAGKQRTLLQRFARRDNHEGVMDAVRQIDHLLTLLPDCATRDEVMGIEGAAARQYFTALSEVVPEDMKFDGRSRQPPGDTINAALSYGYAIILAETVSALCAAGLDPAVGMFHAEQDQRPSLALDLMEEFRPLIVDQVVIAAARRAELRPEHGRRDADNHGILLTKAGREILVSGYERRMLQHTKGALPGMSGSLRRHLYRQAQRIAAYVQDPQATWTGLSWR